MKRLALGLLVIVFLIQTIGCDSGGGSGGASGDATKDTPAPDAPAAGSPGKKGRKAAKIDPKVAEKTANPNGPKHDR